MGSTSHDLPDLSELTHKLDDVFKLLAVDNSFSVTVSEGFILIVPEGPYSHFCATFALYLAKKGLERIQGADGREFRDVIKHLPEYRDDPSKDVDIEEAISRWATESLEEDWEWFEQVRQHNFENHPHSRANIEKAIPVLSNLLKSGQCNIEPLSQFFANDVPESDGGNNHSLLHRAFGQLNGVFKGLSKHLQTAESVQRIALNASELADKG